MKCPNDQTELKPVMYENAVEIDQCEKCSGVWLDKGELDKIQETTVNDYKKDLTKMPDVSKKVFDFAKQTFKFARKCPKCATKFEKKDLGGGTKIIIEECPGCGGLWLDKGELQELEVYHERKKALHDIKEKGVMGSVFGFLKDSVTKK